MLEHGGLADPCLATDHQRGARAAAVDPDAPSLDFAGAALAVAALVALVFSVIEAPTYGSCTKPRRCWARASSASAR